MTLTVRFHVGSQYVIVQFNEDTSSIRDLVQEFLEREEIPIYLHDSIYSSLQALIRELYTDVCYDGTC